MIEGATLNIDDLPDDDPMRTWEFPPPKIPLVYDGPINWRAPITKLPASPALRFQSIGDFIAKEIAPTEWLIQGLQKEKSTGLVAGMPGIGKTLLSILYCADLVSRGRRIAIIEEEGAEDEIQSYLERAFRRYEVTPEQAENALILWGASARLLDPEHLAAIVEQTRGCDLIVLDSLSAVAPIDENSEDQTKLAEVLHVLKTQTGSAIQALCHTVKTSWNTGKPSIADIRGLGSLVGRADAILQLAQPKRHEDGISFEVHPTKLRGRGRAGVLKVQITLTDEEMSMSAVSLDGETTEDAPKAPKPTLEELVIANCRKPAPGSNNGWCVGEVARELRKRPQTVRDEMERLESLGTLKRTAAYRYITNSTGSPQSSHYSREQLDMTSQSPNSPRVYDTGEWEQSREDGVPEVTNRSESP